MDLVASLKPLRHDRRALLTLGFVAVSALLWLVASEMAVWAVGALVVAIGPTVCATALLLLPGLALLRLLWPGSLPPIERWPLAIGLSCASIPLLVLGGSLVGLRWNAFAVWLLIGLALVVVLWPGRAADWRRTAGSLRTYRPSSTQFLLILITLLALALRLYLVRDLPTGMFGDSYHHTMITQLLIDNGGLFQSWQPYAPLKTLTYHYGFHSIAAFLSLLSGLPAATSVLVIGQIEGALAAPLLFLLTLRLLRDERAALFAALLVGFVSIMPAYYVNWGRYTQLGGQTVLVAVIVAWMSLLDQCVEHKADAANGRVRLLILTGLATAGLALTHYRVAVFGACFVVVYALYCAARSVASSIQQPRGDQEAAIDYAAQRRTPRHRLATSRVLASPTGIRGTRLALLDVPMLRGDLFRLLTVGTLTGGVTIVLVLPWLLRLREGALLKIGGYYLANTVAVDAPLTNAFDLYVQPFVAGLAVLGLVLSLVQRRWRIALLPGWAVALWLAANPAQIGLPGTGIVSGVAVLIGSYLVLVPLAAAGLATSIHFAGRLLRQPSTTAAVQIAVGALLVAWGLSWQQHMLTQQTQILYQADVQAFAWIKRETPATAKFFVNSFPAFGGGVYVGSDGGWWLPLLAGRASNVPPATYGTEAGERPNYQLWVKNDNAAILQYDLASAEAVQALRAAGYSYVYDGPGNTAPGGNEGIRPAALAGSPFYESVYNQSGVNIWKIR